MTLTPVVETSNGLPEGATKVMQAAALVSVVSLFALGLNGVTIKNPDIAILSAEGAGLGLVVALFALVGGFFVQRVRQP